MSYPTEIKHVSDLNCESPYDGEIAEEDLWFLPGPMEDDSEFLPPGPRAEADERAQIAAWELGSGLVKLAP